MKRIVLCILGMSVALLGQAQGVFWGSNLNAPTRLGSLDGPFASSNIFGQMFAGPTADSLTPVGPSQMHGPTGGMSVGRVTVPGVPPDQDAYVQMVAWDSTYWGVSLASVPENQLGRTDIVTVYLMGEFPQTVFIPRFTRPAIVPPIPEPSVWTLALLGGLLGLWCFRRSGR